MSWFKVKAVDESKAELWILDQIGKDWWTGDGTVASEFINAVRGLGSFSEATLYMNTPGGDVGDGLTIASFIREHPAKFTAKITGRAASIGSVIACACDEVIMCLGTTMLAHKPSANAGEYLTADGFRRYAEALDQFEEGILDCYMVRAEKKNKTRDEVSAMLREDRVMTASEAIEWGFADSQDVAIKAVACSDIGAVKAMATRSAELVVKNAELVTAANRIAELEKQITDAIPVPVSADEVLKVCAKESLDFMAAKIVSAKADKPTFEKIIADAKAISSVCAAAGIEPSGVVGKINDTAQMLGFAINEALALADANQDTHLAPGAGASAVKAPNAKTVYSQLNNTTEV